MKSCHFSPSNAYNLHLCLHMRITNIIQESTISCSIPLCSLSCCTERGTHVSAWKVLQDSNKSIGKVHAASGISCSLYNATQEINEVDISQERNKENPPICLCSQQVLVSFDNWKTSVWPFRKQTWELNIDNHSTDLEEYTESQSRGAWDRMPRSCNFIIRTSANIMCIHLAYK
jgi:hypothetical protein